MWDPDLLVYPPIPPMLQFAIEAEKLGITTEERIAQFEATVLTKFDSLAR